MFVRKIASFSQSISKVK